MRLKKNKKKIFVASIMIVLMMCSIAYIFLKNNEVEALSKYGSRGDEVIQIQTKLKRWGYYNGNIDGIYGSQTQEAVR